MIVFVADDIRKLSLALGVIRDLHVT